jgi:hypothetical protein
MTTWGKRRGTLYYVLGTYEGRTAVKIGMTTQPVRIRARQLKGQVLACRPGNGDLETAMHAEFADDALGHEWFRPSPRLLAHIESVGHEEESRPQRETPRRRAS